MSRLKPKVFVYPDATRSHDPKVRLNEVGPLLAHFAEKDHFQTHLLLDCSKDDFAQVDADKEAYGIPKCIVIHRVPDDRTRYQQWIVAIERNVRRKIPDETLSAVILNSLPFVALFALLEFAWLRHWRQTARTFIRANDPKVLLVQRDRNLGFSFALIRELRRAGGKVGLLPWGFVNANYSVANRRDDRRNWLDGPQVSIVQLMMRAIHPRQVLRSGDRTYSFFKPGRYIGALLADCLPSNPWFFGADVDVCMIDSEGSKNELVSAGIPAEKVVVTGDPMHDTFFISERTQQVLREKLKAKYGLKKRHILVCAVPHLAEHNLLPWDEHWREIRHILGSCASLEDYDVLASLHPRSDPSTYRFLEQELGVHLLDEPLKQVIAAAHLFVCPWSGTTSWGIVANKPTVVLDWFGLDHIGLASIVSAALLVKNPDALLHTLKEASIRPSNCPKLTDLPPFDGLSSVRIAASTEKLLTQA